MSLETYLQHAHRLTLADVEPDTAPGYWRIREPCGGRDGGCRHPLHGSLFCEGPTRHTVHYTDPPRDACGRWASPYRTWRAARAGEREATAGA